MHLRSINARDFEGAVSLLVRGFPSKSESFWAAGLERLMDFSHPTESGPVGYIMTADAKDVGIILTIPSQQPARRGTTRNVVSLAAWYVDEDHRWLAPRMLQKVLSDPNAVFLDLTPSPAVRPIIERLGFEVLHEGFLVFLSPLAAMRSEPLGVKVLSPDTGGISLAEDVQTMLDHHSKLGCIVAVLRDGESHSPLVFSRLRTRGMPGARLIFAESKAMVASNIATISRFLLRKGVIFLKMDASRGDAIAGSLLSRWSAPTYIKGAADRSRIDFTYSELVFLGAEAINSRRLS
jgi:hypothetical protein